MDDVVKRQQPAITKRSDGAGELARVLVDPGGSQLDVIEQAIEQMSSSRQSIAVLLAPKEPLDFDWDPPGSALTHRDTGLAD